MQHRINQLIGAQLAALGGAGVVMSFLFALLNGHENFLQLVMTAVMAIMMLIGLTMIFKEPVE